MIIAAILKLFCPQEFFTLKNIVDINEIFCMWIYLLIIKIFIY